MWVIWGVAIILELGDSRIVYPERYRGKGFYNGTLDSGGAHHNSTVISHAIYEVYQDSGLSRQEMAELLYHTLYYLPQECTFSQYYNAIYQSALDLGLNYITGDIMRAFITEADIIMGDNINDVNWYNGEIQIGGEVHESILGYAVDNISVKIRAGKDNTTGAYMDLENTSSLRNGFTYTVNNPGFYTVEIVRDGYYIKHQTIVASISRDASDLGAMLSNIVMIDPYPIIKGKVTQPLGNVSVKVFRSDAGVIAQQKRDKIINRAYQWYNLTWPTTQDMALYNGKTLPANTLIRGLPYSCQDGRVSNTIDGVMIGSKNYFKDLSNDAKYKDYYGADCTEFVLDCLWHGDPAIGLRGNGIFTRNTKEITDWTEIQPGDIFRRTGDKAHVIVIVDVDDNGTPEYPADDKYTCMECQSYELGEKQPDGTYMTGMLNHTYTYNAIRTGKDDNWTSGGYKPYRYTAIDDVKPEYETKTDQNGNYSLSMLDGDYIIVFSADNYYDKTIEISVSEDTSIPDITLTPISATTFSVTHTANNVTTDILTASPIEMYNGIATQTWTINSSADWTVTKSGDWFTIDKTGGTAGETVTMTVNITNSTDSQNNGTITFRTAEAEYKVTLVQKASHLKGWIVAGFEQPINGAVVTASDGTTSYACTTGANGVFDIPVPNAYYSISVTADGYENKLYDREIQINGEDVDVGEILLTRSVIAPLTGTIKDGDEDSATYGQVLEGVSFEVYDSTGKKVGDTVKSDENGVVTFDFPGAGTYKFVFSLIGYKTVTVDTVIINEDTPSLGTYVMMRAEFNTSVSGITTPGTKLELLDENGNVIAETVADENGHYDFGDIPGWDGTIFRIRVKETTVTVDTVGGATGVVVDTTVTIFTVSVPEIVGIDNEVGAISEWEIESSHEWSVTATGDTSWYTLSAESGNAGTFEFVVTATGVTDSYHESTLTFALNNRTFDVKIYQNFARTVSGRVVEQTEELGEAGIENAVVVVSRADDSSLYLQTKTDANGQYTLVFEDAGEYVITAQKVGYTMATRYLRVSSETTEIEKMIMEQTTSPYHFNGHTYLKIYPQDYSVSWDEAEAICQALGGHLVSITSEEENSFVTALSQEALPFSRDRYWIGAYKNDGDWSWSDGETFGGYTNWTNEPESTSLYGVLYSKKNNSQSGGWLNTQDDHEYSYGIICEWDDELDFLEGVCLNDLKWQFALDGTDKLTVSGEGILENDYYTVPWRDLEYNISVVELTSGITEIGEYGLNDTYYATEVILPDTLEKIDNYNSYLSNGYRKNYTVSADNTTYASVDGVLFSKDMTTLIDYPTDNERKEYSVPDGVTVIKSLNGDALKVINIPASVNSWNTNGVDSYSLKEINVDVDNTAFMSIEGVLFNRSGTSLLKYPGERFAEGNTYRIPDGVTTIGSYAFYKFDITDYEDVDRVDGGNAILSIIFPESVATIGESNCFIGRFYYYRHMNLYFEGDAPLFDSSYSYWWYDERVLERTTIYYTAGKNGWTSPSWYPSYKSGSTAKLLDMRIPTVLQDAYATVSGQVVDESGTPLKNVEIQGKYDDKLTGIAYTDDNGEYFFQFESATTCDLRYYLDGYEAVFVDRVDITNGEYTLDTVTMTPGAAILGSGTTREGKNWTLQGSELIITCGDDNSSGVYYLSEGEIEECPFWSPNDIWKIKKINIGEGITTLELGELRELSVEELYIGADVSEIEFWGNSIVYDYRIDDIDIVIDPMNTDFVITDGALYTSDYKTLLLAPKDDRSVTDYSIRDGVEIIGTYAFNGSDYKTINIPSTVSTLEASSFLGCGLTSIHIPSSVISIDSNVFASSGLHTITVDAANPEYMAVDNILYNKAQTKLITVPCTLTGSLFIPDGVTSIGSYAMYRTRLDRIIIPASVTSIGSHAMDPYYSSGCKIYFLGDVPETMSEFNYPGRTLYYLEGTSGWSTPTTVIGGKTYGTEPFTMDELN